MRILFLGSSGPLSVIPLRYLMQSEHELCAIGYETLSGAFAEDMKYPIIASQNENVEMLARVSGIPAIKLFDDDGVYVESIAEYVPDIIIVSCLGSKLVDEIISIPRLGCFNLHPSLLPLFRGPVPLFWQFRQGVDVFGITLHRMNADYDSGPIVAQNSLLMPDGVSNQQASELLAKAGSELLDEYLEGECSEDESQEKIARAEVVEQLQKESESSTMSFPTAADFEVSTSWTARRLYNFICATRHWGQCYPCTIDGTHFRLLTAISYRTTCETGQVPESNQGLIVVPCVDGTVTAKIAIEQPLRV